jgi:hypothetical protein
MRAYRQIVTIEHHDGTPDTEQVNLLCEECFRNEWTREETGIADWQQLRDSVIRNELRPALMDAEIEGDNLAQLWNRAVAYDQVEGNACEHLQNALAHAPQA